MRFGIKSLTMDDIAKNLRISKKTLYQFVSDKSDLVLKCIETGCAVDETEVNRILGKNLNAIDEIYEISQFVVSRLNIIHPSIFYELSKYHPEAMAKFDAHRVHFIARTIEENLKKGIAEGYYREDLKIPIITKVYLTAIDEILHGESFRQSEYSITQLYIELFRYHVRGIASDKGIKYLVRKVKKENLIK